MEEGGLTGSEGTGAKSFRMKRSKEWKKKEKERGEDGGAAPPREVKEEERVGCGCERAAKKRRSFWVSGETMEAMLCEEGEERDGDSDEDDEEEGGM